MNILDIIVVIVSFLGITTGDWANISAIRLLRFFHDPREKKFGRSDDTPSPLVEWFLFCFKNKIFKFHIKY